MTEYTLTIDLSLLASDDDDEARRKAEMLVAQIESGGVAVAGWSLGALDPPRGVWMTY